MNKCKTSCVAHTLLILVILYASGPWLASLKQSALETLEPGHFYLAQLGLFVLIGVLLGFIELLVHEVRNTGSWALDIFKMTFAGIPLGLFACTHLIYFSNGVPTPVIQVLDPVVHTDAGQVVAAQLIFGYILITSFHKSQSTSD